jgi:uncharacterized protein DUF4375
VTEPTTTCLDCGVSILTATAAKTGGKCIPCARGTRTQIDQSIRLAAEQRERDRKNRLALERIKTKERPTFRDFAAEDDSVAVLWSFLIATVFRDRTGRENVDALTPSAKVLYLAQILDGEVFNGGFHQYFSNTSGEYAHRTLFALHELGATRRASLLQRAIATFPNKRVPRNRKKRNDELDKADPAILEGLDNEYCALETSGIEDLNERILAFIGQHAGDCIAA